MWFISKKRPSVSVVITSYNHADYIHEAVASVLEQDLKDIEVIVIDDGSTDETQEILKNIKDSRVKVVQLSENRRFHPRNAGLLIAHGKYVAFQNSDDRWEQGKLRKQVQVLEQDPRISACFTGVSVIDEKGEVLENSWAKDLFTIKNRGSSEWLRHFFDSGNCLCIASSMIKKESLKVTGQFKPSLINLSDFDLWVRFAAIGEFYIIPEELIKMRIIPGKNLSAPSAQVAKRSTMEFLEVLGRYKEQLILKKLKDVFHDIYTHETKSEAGLLGGLSRYAWGKEPVHIMFANKIIAELLDDNSKREELISIYGTDIIHTYIQKKSALEIQITTD